MQHRALFALSVLFFLAGSGSAPAQPAPESHARIELIADGPSFAPGRPLWAGVLFHLDAGWHIYWQNAGDSGQPPNITWNLPPGFRAGAVQWPKPKRLGTGTVVDYGYEDQVLLVAPIEAPADQSRAVGVLRLAADVGYVVCREVCIPGKAHLSLTVTDVTDAVQISKWRRLFADARAQLPKPAPAGWKISAASGKDHFILTVAGLRPPHSAVFFPSQAGVIENAAPQSFTAAKNAFQLALRKSDQLAKPISKLRGVLVLDEDRGYEIAAPVAAP